MTQELGLDLETPQLQTMSNAEIPSEPAAATRQEEAPESAEAIADRILGNSANNFEMSSLSRETEGGSGSPPSVLPLAADSSGSVPTQAPAGTAAAPITETSVASEALHGDAAPVSPSDILTRAVVLTIINTTTDSRHKVVLDDNYLAKRSVSPPEGLITNLSVYTLKELIWRDWRHGDWEERPRDPSFIRLIHMGRMLEDNTFLRGTLDCIWYL